METYYDTEKAPCPGIAAFITSFTIIFSSIPAGAQGDVNLRWSIEGVTDLASLDPAKASDSQGFTVIYLLYGGLYA